MLAPAAARLAVVVRLVGQPDLAAGVNLAMGVVPWIVTCQAEAIRHPGDPSGGSGSAAIQGFYLLIGLTVAGLAATLVAWLWVDAEIKRSAPRKCVASER